MTSISFFVWLVLVLAVVAANPTVLRQFRQAVNSDACLKQCLDQVRRTDVELSFIRRSNLSDYLLNLDQVCDIIRSARSCLQGCDIRSNPFALRSTVFMCEEQSRQIAAQLRTCMRENGRELHQRCADQCGDHEVLRDQLVQLNERLSHQERPDVRGVDAVRRITDNSCRAYKCEVRCQVVRASGGCSRLADGNDAGGALRYLIEANLALHRVDLEQNGVLATFVAQSTPECDYQYAPEVLFDEQRDRTLMATVQARQQQTANVAQQQPSQQNVNVPQPQQNVNVPQQQQPQQNANVPQPQLLSPFVAQPQPNVQPTDNRFDSKLNMYKLQLLMKKDRNLDLEAAKFIKELEQLASP